MSAPFVIPFNYQPSGTYSFSGNITIPQGQYGLLDYKLHSGTLRLNGTLIDAKAGVTEIYQDATTASTSTSEATLITASSTSAGWMTFYASAEASANSNTRTFRHKRNSVILDTFTIGTAGGSASVTTFVLPNDTFTAQQSSGAALDRSISLIGIADRNITNSNQIWLKSGDVLALTGPAQNTWASITGTITLFNNIT